VSKTLTGQSTKQAALEAILSLEAAISDELKQLSEYQVSILVIVLLREDVCVLGNVYDIDVCTQVPIIFV